MKRVLALLPVLFAFQAGAPPALAWTWPVDGPVLQPFSLGDDPYAAGQHRGVDVAAPAGSPVLAPAAGTVSFAGTVPEGGRTVTVRTADGYAVTLVHLGAIAVRQDARVAEGAAVGTVGPSGEAEHARPYVHLGIRVADDPHGYLDPLGLLPARELTPPPAPDHAEGEEAPAEDPVAAPAPAPVVAPQPVNVPAPATPPAAPATPDEPPVRPAAAERVDPIARPASRSAPVEVESARLPGVGASSRRDRATESAGAAAPGRGGSPPAERAAHTTRRSSEPVGRPAVGIPSAVGVPPAGGRAETSGASRRSATGTAVLGAALAGLAVLAAALAARRRQLGDAGPAHAAAPVLLDAAGGPAEDACRARPAEENRLVPHGDLEWITLRQPEPLADLDGDDDPAQLVKVPDDSGGRRSATTVVAGPRSHRARRHRSSRCRPERVAAR
jgi:murein DD-endopeptidase MepM/ murein hydrolase activator NlpD